MEPIVSRPTEEPAMPSFEPPGVKKTESLRSSIEAAIRGSLKEDVVLDVFGCLKVVTCSGAIEVDFDASRSAHSPLNSTVSPVKFENSLSPDSGLAASRDLPLPGNRNKRKNSRPIRLVDLAEDLTKKEAPEEAPLDLCLSSKRPAELSKAPVRPEPPLTAAFAFNPLLQMLASPEVFPAAPLGSQFMVSSLIRSGPPPLLLPKEPEAKGAPVRMKRIRSASNLNRAKRTGSSKCFRCNQCGCSFPALALLSKHTFNAHRAFRCMVCGSNFTQRSNLQRHSLKHVGFKPFICNICNRAYYRKDHLVRHIEVTHPGNEPRANITSKLSSSECLDYLDNMIRAGHIAELRLNASSPDNSSLNEEAAEGMDCGDENACSDASCEASCEAEGESEQDVFVFKKEEDEAAGRVLDIAPSEVCVK